MRRLTPGELRALVRKAVDPDDAVRGDLGDLVEDLLDVIENLIVADNDVERAREASDNARGRGNHRAANKYHQTAGRMTRKKQQILNALREELAMGADDKAVDLLEETA